MPLRTFVKVSSISNLSDARYCAGMGVDLLGFCAIENEENYIKPARFQEIRGWVTGPKIVAEVYGLKEADQIHSILENYKPDFLELGLKELPFIAAMHVPIILSFDNAEELESLSFAPAYLIGKKPVNLKIPLLMKVNSSAEAESILTDPNINGIVLKGGTELKPGLKETEMINEVLELLETDE
jgi:phosphoribosylanthranilate isomerase